MATRLEWAQGFARQAAADFETFERLTLANLSPACHALQFLQMACEKLVKSHLCAQKSSKIERLTTSHDGMAKTLPLVLRSEATRRSMASVNRIMPALRRIAEEIEVLAPAVDRDGRRPENSEYPWTDDTGTLHSPLAGC